MDKNKNETPDGLSAIRWDDLTITREAGYMPEPLREDYIWLKSFTRDHCAKSGPALLRRLQDLGFAHDATAWNRILRGRWCRRSNGQTTDVPVMEAEQFSAAVQALRDQARVDSIHGVVPFVCTSTWDLISDAIDERRDPARVNKFLVLVGPTGSQKSACLRQYQLLNNHGATRYIEAPEGASHARFLQAVAASCGFSPTGNMQALESHIFRTFSQGTASECAKRVLIIDNAQEAWSPKNIMQPSFTFLRRLQDQLKCVIVLSITPLFERTLMEGLVQGWFEQIEGRSGGRKRWIRLPEFAPDSDVLAIAKAFGLQDYKAHLPALRAISREPGRIRRLFEDLQDGKLRAAKGQFLFKHILEGRGEEEGE